MEVINGDLSGAYLGNAECHHNHLIPLDWVTTETENQISKDFIKSTLAEECNVLSRLPASLNLGVLCQ